MDIPGLLHGIKSSRGYEDQIVHMEDIRKRQPEYADIELSPLIKNALVSIGIEKLYSHQASAIERIRSGENVVIVTSTASGKSLAYMIPIFEKILANPKATALYIAPTNALVNDQLAGFNEFRDELGFGIAIRITRYIGDESRDDPLQFPCMEAPLGWLSLESQVHRGG